ncbi:unnamed protein product [Ectocarpus sp. CCAP 1310/34]|nr:unnamed protein product [Ectocarpus sp. CCAP 1310/34]
MGGWQVEHLSDWPHAGSRITHWFRWIWRFFGRFAHGVLLGDQTALLNIVRNKLRSDDDGNDNDQSSTDIEKQQTKRPRSDGKKTTCVVASFDAWLYADTQLLWARLLCGVFVKVEARFGKFSVRRARVRNAFRDPTLDVCAAAALATLLVGAVAQAIADEVGWEDVGNVLGYGGVPRVLYIAIKGRGENILAQARSMGKSVGSSHLGFMAEVEEELQLLLDMIKDMGTEKEKFALVVSIDNLDRCPHDDIVQVLQAVHFLLEKPGANFILILALDSRVVIAAIGAGMDDLVRQRVSGSEYLEKIIYVPFFIPDGTMEDRKILSDVMLKACSNPGK